MLLTPDMDVFVLGLFLCQMRLTTLQNYTVGKLLCTHFGLCVLSCLRVLMGCDITSKVGTKHAVIKADPIVYLGQFGKQINQAHLFDITLLAEHYLVKVLKQGTSCTIWMTFTIDSTTIAKTRLLIIQQLPPISQETRLDIMRSISTAHVHMNCLTGASIDPLVSLV